MITANERIHELEEKVSCLDKRVEFLLYELRRENEKQRWLEFQQAEKSLLRKDWLTELTKSSFDYQWEGLKEGKGLLSDPDFMNNLVNTICNYLGGINPDAIRGKHVADVGCGIGRFTYGFLSMGATVSAFDQSEHALLDVKNMCATFADSLKTHRVDLVNDSFEEYRESFDIVWSYGVVHHTGNTYLAMDNVCKMVRPGGLVFMMIYGFPENDIRFGELNCYEKLRFDTRNMSFTDKISLLRSRFPEDQVHGYFDAISPQINDLLTFDEIENFMMLEGFDDIKRTFENDNIHFIAKKMTRRI